MKTFCYLACALALIAMPSMALAAAGPGPYNLLAAIDDTSIRATADPHVFTLHDARGRAGQIGTLTGTENLLVEICTTNLITNTSFESDLSGWYSIGSVVSMSRSNHSYIGTYGGSFLADARYEGIATTVNFLSGVSGTCSAWIKSDGDTAIAIRKPDGSALSTTVVVGDGSWHRASVGFLAMDTGAHIVRVWDNESSGFSPIYVDGAQCEVSSYPTAFTTSYRMGKTVEITAAGSAGAGAVELWWTPLVGSSSPEYRHLINDVSENGFISGWVLGDQWTFSAGGHAVQFTQAFDAGEQLHIVFRWDDGLQATINGYEYASDSGDFGDMPDSGVWLCSAGQYVPCAGELSAVRFYRSLTEDQVTWLYNSGAGRSVAEVENMVEVVEGETGTFMVDPTVTYGQAGDIITGLLSGGLVLFLIVLQVVAWFRQ